MSVRVRSTGLKLDKTVMVTAATMRDIGDLAATEVRERTLGGQDADGRAFHPYSEGYAQQKALYRAGGSKNTSKRLRAAGVGVSDMRGRYGADRKAGRTNASWGRYVARRVAVNIGPPDLMLTGDMLGKMGVTEVSARRVVVGFRTARAAEKAFYHVETGAGRSRVIRDFFGLSAGFLGRARACIKASWT